MPAYRLTVTPHSSLFLARERGNRAIRRSFPYIPASTASGALNTRLYQLGWDGLMRTFRFSNLYPACDGETVWLPAPRTLYRCPVCSQVNWMRNFDPADMVSEMMCSVCGAMRRPARGFVSARLAHDAVQPSNLFRERVSALNAQLSGRVALHRTTGGQVDGQLHFIEVLRARNLAFRGLAWVESGASTTFQPGARFRLAMGGMRSRGSGRVTLAFEAATSQGTSIQVGDVLLVETPVLPLPEALDGASPTLTVQAVSPYARVEVCERWAAKPLRWGKGLVSFLDVVAMGSVLKVSDGTASLRHGLFFYKMADLAVELFYLEPPFPSDPVVGEDYTVEDLWTLGFGQLRRFEDVIT